MFTEQIPFTFSLCMELESTCAVEFNLVTSKHTLASLCEAQFFFFPIFSIFIFLLNILLMHSSMHKHICGMQKNILYN